MNNVFNIILVFNLCIVIQVKYCNDLLCTAIVWTKYVNIPNKLMGPLRWNKPSIHTVFVHLLIQEYHFCITIEED